MRERLLARFRRTVARLRETGRTETLDDLTGANRVQPRLYLGSADAAQAPACRQFDHVISVAEGLELDVTTHQFDLYPDERIRDREAEFRDAVRAVRNAIDGDDQVLVHCYEGRERAPTVVATALAIERGSSFDEVFERIREARPIVDPPESLRELGREVVEAHGGRTDE